MLLHTALCTLCLTAYSLSTPLHNIETHTHKLSHTRRSSQLPKLDKLTAITAQAAARQKFRNAPALLAGHGTFPGYVIPSSLQHTYNRLSNYATDITLLTSNSSSSGVRIATTNTNTTPSIPLLDDTDGVDDFEYYGQLGFGTPPQMQYIDFDTGSADIWTTTDSERVGSFQANNSSTYLDTGADFSVTYGSGYVTGTLAQDTVIVGTLKVHDQFIGAVRELSPSFSGAPNDGLAGLAFSTIASSRKPTIFENLISQLPAPIFSFHMTRTQPRGSEVCFGCIDQSKVKGDNISWVQVISQTYWTVSMIGVLVNSLIPTNVSTIIDTGTSFIYIPDDITAAIYDQIPGSAVAPEYGYGFYSYPCATQVSVSFVLGGMALPLDPRDMNLGQHTDDPSKCIGAIAAAGSIFGGENMAIFGDSFLKSYISIFDYSHGARVGFVESIDE